MWEFLLNNPVQLLLIFVILVLTIVLALIGWEFFVILKELKKTISKINNILDDTGRITNALANPVEEASEFLIGLKKGVSFISSLSKFFKSKDEQKLVQAPEAEEEPKTKEKDKKLAKAKKEKSASKKASKPRFFFKKGKSLGK